MEREREGGIWMREGEVRKEKEERVEGTDNVMYIMKCSSPQLIINPSFLPPSPIPILLLPLLHLLLFLPFSLSLPHPSPVPLMPVPPLHIHVQVLPFPLKLLPPPFTHRLLIL